MAIQRISSPTHRLDQGFLAEQLQVARRYWRIAGYFTSSLFEIALEWLEPIPEVRIVCNVDLITRRPEGRPVGRDVSARALERALHRGRIPAQSRLSDLPSDLREDLETELERVIDGATFFQRENPVVRHVVLRKRTTLETAWSARAHRGEYPPGSGIGAVTASLLGAVPRRGTTDHAGLRPRL